MQAESIPIESNSSRNESNKRSADSKILKDLATLVDQIKLCYSMLRPSDGSKVHIDSNDALLSVIGFLEACVPRMIELIDAGAQGALAEETMVKCLEVNDALCQTLENLDTPLKLKKVDVGILGSSANSDEGSGSPSQAAAVARPASAHQLDLDDLLLSNDDKEGIKSSNVGEGSNGNKKNVSQLDKLLGEMDDLLEDDNYQKKSVPVDEAKKAEADFDDFFGERMSKN